MCRGAQEGAQEVHNSLPFAEARDKEDLTKILDLWEKRCVQRMQAEAFRLPPFSAEDPALWLAQVECACRVAGIADSSVKFDLLVANLPTDVARQVRDVITATPASYTALTSALQARLAQSRAARLSALLRNTQLGDQKPTQLLLRMRSELGEEAQDSALLRTLFLQRLPRAATAALSLLPEDTSLSHLAAAADRYLEATGPHELATVQLTDPTACATAGDVPTLHSTVASLTAAEEVDQQEPSSEGYTPWKKQMMIRVKKCSPSSKNTPARHLDELQWEDDDEGVAPTDVDDEDQEQAETPSTRPV
ncbi:hypothetical protein FJT64_009252 [Amphibalanus amphitrite]|uniref:DUF7041 domain-containing protein n=1 Tax=Amphibalanus amphitrite TaxID=1232801 RepID=A0A6A4VMP4_AMPAM|nr:hypothetical protein FJT64_009252 [Amphibalanus amphitrite]